MAASTRRAAQRLLVVVAHPDDESFGTGSLIAHAAARGHEVTVCCATRGEAGEAPDWLEAEQNLADLRTAELYAAAKVLGVARVVPLDFVDSGMAGDAAPDTLVGAPLSDVVAAVAAVVDDIDPQIVVTLDPVNGDGHRDHVRIGVAAIEACAGRDVRVYVYCLLRPLLAQWFAEIERLRPDTGHLDLDRAGLGRLPEDVTTVLDSADVLSLREAAIASHASQVSPFEGMPEDLRAAFLTREHLVQVQPPWPGGPPATSLG